MQIMNTIILNELNLMIDSDCEETDFYHDVSDSAGEMTERYEETANESSDSGELIISSNEDDLKSSMNCNFENVCTDIYPRSASNPGPALKKGWRTKGPRPAIAKRHLTLFRSRSLSKSSAFTILRNDRSDFSSCS